MAKTEFDTFRARVERDAESGRRYFGRLQVHRDQSERALLRQLRLLNAGSVSPRALLNGLHLLENLDLRDELSELRQPVLVILGDRDTLVPDDLGGRLRCTHHRVTVWTMDGAAHIPFRSKPGAFAARVIDFLAQHVAPSPPKRVRASVAASFSRANEYDQAASLQREVGAVLSRHLPLANCQRLVDLGCGTGQQLPVLSARAADVFGVDLAEGMLHRARKAAVGRCRWLCADAEQLPISQDAIDLVYSNLAIQWCENLAALARQCARILRPGGSMLLSTLGPSTLWELRAAWRAVDASVHVNRFARFDELEAAFADAGFSLVMRDTAIQTRFVDRVVDLARELRQLGAHNVNPGRPQGLSGRARWQRLETEYGALRNGEGRLPVSWEVGLYRFDWC